MLKTTVPPRISLTAVKYELSGRPGGVGFHSGVIAVMSSPVVMGGSVMTWTGSAGRER